MLQIVLHAAAILVCVKRHNKPGCRTCLGGGGAEEKPRLWVGTDGGGGVGGSQSFGGVLNKKTETFFNS